MFAVICSQKYWKEIEQAISLIGEEIVYKFIDNDIDSLSEFEKIGRIAVKYLIIDVTAIEGHKKLIQAVKRYRIMNNYTQLIVIAPNCEPGNELLHSLVTMGIYDIFSPAGDEIEKMNISASLIDMIKKPTSYKKAVRWVIDKEVNINDSSIVIEKIVEVEGEKPDSFKKLILTVWDNAEFGCELAYMAAKLSGLEVLLVDADLLSPKADLILNVNRQPDNIKTEGLFGNSGLNIIMDTIEKNVFTPTFFTEACVNRKELKNLHVLTGNYSIENYEYYTKDSYKIFLEKCYHAFDLVIVLVNRSMYDLFTLISLDKSDYNIIAIKPDLISIRDFNSHIQFLHEKQHINKDKFKFIGFETIEGLGIKDSILKEVTEDNFLGHVSYSSKRAAYRNLKAPYIRRIPIKQIDEYKDILAYFKIIPKRKFMDRIRSRNKIFKLKLRSFFKKLKLKRKKVM